MANHYLRNCVLPLVEVSISNGMYVYEIFHGTCFLIGSRGYAITNAHLLGVEEGNLLGAMMVDDSDRWDFFVVESEEAHPTEDVAILKLKGLSYPSFLQIVDDSEHASLSYMQWSYPEDVENELVVDGYISHRPDLIYLQGYIRRRMQDTQVYMIGKSFYELSEPASAGCSGSPLIPHSADRRHIEDNWKVVGVYCGQRVTTANGHYSAVGYAVRTDSFAGWRPSILEHEIQLEYTRNM